MKNNQIILAIGICIAIATSANAQGSTRPHSQKSLAANAQGDAKSYTQKDIETDAREPIDYVDPFIGTTNFSVCNPGAICPNGMMSVVPFNVMGGPT
jgi:hypothetical protein